ncbi:hypothetical protein LTS10_003748 [Elasticomyces elasticus]|nr:hypothetical protein LTS10_003748 [Elasticomyces elasticus]
MWPWSRKSLGDMLEGPTHSVKRPKPTPGDDKAKSCTVCTDLQPATQFPVVVHLGYYSKSEEPDRAAKHGSEICYDCWTDHIHFAVANPAESVIRCPECEGVLDEIDVRILGQPEDVARHLEKLSVAFIKQCSEYRECPSSTCTYGYIMAKDDGNIFHCQTCDLRYCTDCEAVMHSGKTCAEHRIDQAEQQKGEEEESTKYLASQTQICPGCKISIRKAGGCNHITCSHCKHQFCWVCFAPYKGAIGINTIGNRAHTQNCLYYPTRLPGIRAEEIPPESDDDGDMGFDGLDEAFD